MRFGVEIFFKGFFNVLICIWLRKYKNESSGVLCSVIEFLKSLSKIIEGIWYIN